MKTKLAKLQNTWPTKYPTAPVVPQSSYLYNKFRYQLPECGTAPHSISTLCAVT